MWPGPRGVADRVLTLARTQLAKLNVSPEIPDPLPEKVVSDLVFHLSSVCDVSHFFAVSRGHAADKALPLVRHLGCESGS
jgi:hypothetical protein